MYRYCTSGYNYNLELEFCTTLHDSSQDQPATGGEISYPSGDTTLHKFVSSGSFTVTTGPLLVEYLILAGGGAGGGCSAWIFLASRSSSA